MDSIRDVEIIDGVRVKEVRSQCSKRSSLKSIQRLDGIHYGWQREMGL